MKPTKHRRTGKKAQKNTPKPPTTPNDVATQKSPVKPSVYERVAFAKFLSEMKQKQQAYDRATPPGENRFILAERLKDAEVIWPDVDLINSGPFPRSEGPGQKHLCETTPYPPTNGNRRSAQKPSSANAALEKSPDESTVRISRSSADQRGYGKKGSSRGDRKDIEELGAFRRRSK